GHPWSRPGTSARSRWPWRCRRLPRARSPSSASRRPGPSNRPVAAGEGKEPDLRGRHVLLGVSGGIAAYKAVILARLLVRAGAEVQVLMTPTATRFVGPATFAAVTGRPVPTDVLDSPEIVVHVRLAHWAEVAVVAPATANALAKLALGL